MEVSGEVLMIHQLREEGLSISAIARRVGLDRKYLKAGLTGRRMGRVQALADIASAPTE